MTTGARPGAPARSGTALPAEVRAALAGFAAGRELLAGGELRAGMLAGGVENRVWRVVGGAADWVVRLAGPRDARLAVDRRRECACLRLAAAHGFAPAVVHADAATGLLVAVHVAGSTWTRAHARAPGNIARLGARLRALHAVAVPPDLPAVEPRTTIERYLALEPPAGAAVPRAALAALATGCLARLAPRTRALCHHDLHHRNVLDAGTLVFVDWEYAGRGEPLLDLAAIAAYHDFDAPRRAALLAAYGDPAIEAARFAVAGTLFDCLQALWYDAADAWHTLTPAARAALVTRLLRAAR